MERPEFLLGLVPIGKFVFSHECALTYKAKVEDLLNRIGVNYVNIDTVIPDGIVRDQAHVDGVVSYLKSQNVGAIFMPHCNFGTEGACGMIGKKLGLPVLLWGPRDEAPLPDGTRPRDSLCGLFASSKVLHKLGVPFTYIENCRLDEPALEQGIRDFVAAANVAKAMRSMRIGMVGKRIDFFWSCIVNESELLERFGIEIVPIDLIEIIRATRRRAGDNRPIYMEEIESLKNKKNITLEGFASAKPLINVLSLRDEMLHRASDLGLTAFAVESFMSICEELGAMVEFVHGELSERGIPCVPETDIHGAISSVLLQHAALGTEPTFLADLTNRHPERDDAVLLWHCGFPLGLRHADYPASIGTHWILPGIPPGSCHWRMKDGPLTVCRFDGDRGEYRLCAGEGHTCDGPKTQNVYCWMAVKDWPRWERTFIEGPYIHHVAAAYGHHARVLREAVRYIDGLDFESPDKR
ncbi:MAG: fucose isomerase [Phycisphaerae bacterium]|nr:fucose isomerase [Phycisphaerae bacterium]